MADVNGVNERLNNLITLLQAVGISGVSQEDMARVSQSLGQAAGGNSQLNEAQLEQLIRKLQVAQDSAPQIIAALEANARTTAAAPAPRQSRPPPPPPAEEEEEDSDSFDEDADYPMVGHGVSDDVSVVSDLTTPTVVSSLHIPEEEHYRDGSLPPMMIGGDGTNIPSMMIAPPKRKNLVQSQRPGGGIAPPPARRASTARPDRGGAASARLKNYQTTMAKLGSDPPVPKKGVKKTSQTAATAAATPAPAPKKKAPTKKKTDENFSDLAASRGSDGWGGSVLSNNKSPRPAAPKKKAVSGGKTPIDDDGFLVGDGFDPFDAQANPFKSSAGDLEFGMASGGGASDPFRADFDAFGSFGGMSAARPASSVTGSSNAAAKPRVKKPTMATTQQGAGLQRKVPAHSKSAEGRPRRARRASAIS